MNILGLDISSSSTGFGILDGEGRVVEFGQFRPSVKLDNPAKYAFMAFKIAELSKQFEITDIVIESYFVNKVMGQSTFICAEARGAIKAAVSMFMPKATIHSEVSPSSLKKELTGEGNASKYLMAKTVLDKLGIEYTDLIEIFENRKNKKTGEIKRVSAKARFMVGENKFYDDCSDALSLAYCHYLRSK